MMMVMMLVSLCVFSSRGSAASVRSKLLERQARVNIYLRRVRTVPVV
jgi:hypothetical protein